MPGPKLAVRLAVVAFGLLILGGAWLVSTGDSPDSPGTDSTPGQLSADQAVQAPPKLSNQQGSRVTAIVAADPYVSLLAQGTDPAIARPAVWKRPNGELLGGGVEVEFSSPQDYPVVEWPYVVNTDVLNEEDNTIIEPGVRPESATFRAGATNVEGLIVLVDLATGRVVSVSPTGKRVNLFPTQGQALPFDLASAG
jgi:hypothetical protein